MESITIENEEFKELLVKEVQNLKKELTKIERNKLKSLNAGSIYHISSAQCIYGRITGDCNSKRALELITKCCPRILSSVVGRMDHVTINGEPKNLQNRNKTVYNWYSFIEIYIAPDYKYANNNNHKRRQQHLLDFFNSRKRKFIPETFTN